MKELLYIGLNFHSYEPFIIKALKDFGFNVHYYVDAPSAYVSHETMINKQLGSKLISNHQMRIIKETSRLNLELIFVIVGRYLTVDFFKSLKMQNPHAKIILYLWDDVKRVQNFKQTYNYYDEIFSFDINDCEQYGFKFLPLFFTPDFDCQANSQKEMDIYSAMYMHSDRLEISEKILKDLSATANINIVFGTTDYIRLQLNPKERKMYENLGIHIRKREISRENVIQGVSSAKCVLDIQHPTQQGLTIRTFETLCCGTKMITTNANIVHYDFFDPQNICVIDRREPKVDIDFLNAPYRPVEDEIVKKYALNNWLRVILSHENYSYLK